MIPAPFVLKSKSFNFNAHAWGGSNSSLLVNHRGNKTDIGRFSGVEGKILIFPGHGVYLSADELGELSDFVRDLQTKFTTFGIIDETKISPSQNEQPEFTPSPDEEPEFIISQVNAVNSTTTPTKQSTSKGVACKCVGTMRDKKRHWVVTQYRGNCSAFNGRKFTPSQFSEINCKNCGNTWRTNRPYADELPRLEQSQKEGRNV